MLFESPFSLTLLLLIPLLALWYFKSGIKNQGTLQISSERYTSLEIRRSGLYKKNIILCLHLLITILIIIALSRPQKIDKITENSVNVVDISEIEETISQILTPKQLEVAVFAVQAGFYENPRKITKKELSEEKVINELSLSFISDNFFLISRK